MSTDVTKAAHKPVKVVDAITNTASPLWSPCYLRISCQSKRDKTHRNERNGRPARAKNTEANVWELVGREPREKGGDELRLLDIF